MVKLTNEDERALHTSVFYWMRKKRKAFQPSIDSGQIDRGLWIDLKHLVMIRNRKLRRRKVY